MPLGVDPKSMLMEFGHLRSGKLPVRDKETGELRVDDESSLVFILVPGGKVDIGAQSKKKSHPNYDLMAGGDEGDVFEVEVQAFFLSKFEMSHAQWNRLAGNNPELSHDAFAFELNPRFEKKPIVKISWHVSHELCRRFGLYIPTEVEWEYACRAGTTTPWSSGRELSSLEGHGNLADERAARSLGVRSPVPWRDADVGRAFVDSYGANPFGLHNMHGNVWEWCQDRYKFYASKKRREEGVAPGREHDGNRVMRGGSYRYNAAWARSAKRNHIGASFSQNTLGLRPARKLLDATGHAVNEARKGR